MLILVLSNVTATATIINRPRKACCWYTSIPATVKPFLMTPMISAPTNVFNAPPTPPVR